MQVNKFAYDILVLIKIYLPLLYITILILYYVYSKYDMGFCVTSLLVRELLVLFLGYSCASLCMMQICGSVGIVVQYRCRHHRL